MKFDKRIMTHKWGDNEEFTNSNGFVISAGSYRRDIKFFQKLAEEAKKDFPFLKDGDIEVFIITKSSYNKGFGGVRFPLPENTQKKGYYHGVRLDFDYE